MIVPFCICMWLIFSPASQESSDNIVDGINVNVPEGKVGKIEQDKNKAGEIVRQEEQQSERLKSLGDDPFGLFQPNEQDVTGSTSEVVNIVPGHSSVSRPPDRIRQSQQAHEKLARQMNSFYNEPADDNEVEKLKAQIAKLEQEQKQRASIGDPVDYMERSYALAQKYLNPSQSQGEVQQITKPDDNTPLAVYRATDMTVSELSASGDTLILGGEPLERNTGFNTAVGVKDHQIQNAIRVCVDADQILSNGSSIKLRLSEGLMAGNVAIPANTVIYGKAQINGQRMSVEVTTIEYGGNIIPVQLTAHDLDGQQGLYIPDSKERNALKDAAANMGQSFGSSISFARSAGQQVAMDLARGALTGGTQYLATKIREVKVAVKANYQLLLVTK